MSQHTPGPWIQDRVKWHEGGSVEYRCMIASGSRTGLRVAHVLGDYHNQRHAADARLIAAAPELAICVAELVEALQQRGLMNSPAISEARALLARLETK